MASPLLVDPVRGLSSVKTFEAGNVQKQEKYIKNKKQETQREKGREGARERDDNLNEGKIL